MKAFIVYLLLGVLLTIMAPLSFAQQNLSAQKPAPDVETLKQRIVEYFDKFNEPEGIKEILIHHAADRTPEVETKCLELLEEKVPEFVKDWQTQKETTNTKTEESS